MDEFRALRALQEDSHEAFTWLVRRYQEDLMHLAYRLTGNVETAQDLVQETLWRLWQHREDLDPTRSARGWLVTILSRLSVDHWRRERRWVPLDHNLYMVPRQRDPRLDRLERCLQQLSQRQRTVVVLFYTEGYPIQEIATILGVSAGTVKTHLFRARETLRRCMEAKK